MEWFKKCMTTHYFNFSGRARRKEFWMFTLILFLIRGFLGVVSIVMATNFSNSVIFAIFTVFYFIIDLIFIIPSISVAVRRLHDIDMSGWWLLLGLVPIIGWITIVGAFCQNSEPLENSFGPNPKLDSTNKFAS